MIAFCDNYNLTSLIKQPTCYKNPNNPTCIDLILSNRDRYSIYRDRTIRFSFNENSTRDLSIIGPTKTSQMKPLGNVY